ncbi:MAG: hypothetical protein PHX87_05040 [Candidatus Peribacteraceae bacterium]|nr:hypothetical protein [Candidatus Peribacteraceae bacterium]MDD5742761.1 hypothetical protein [Candidatus Peribacteraceae bacterium]
MLPEDSTFFAGILGNGDAKVLERDFGHYFDTRDPHLKRAEFNAKRHTFFADLKERYGRDCMLQYGGMCQGEATSVDHLIPLSSNVLNKQLRHMKAQPGKKVPTQSFGSNHPDNLILACERCNAFKKHRFLSKEEWLRVTELKRQLRHHGEE